MHILFIKWEWRKTEVSTSLKVQLFLSDGLRGFCSLSWLFWKLLCGLTNWLASDTHVVWNWLQHLQPVVRLCCVTWTYSEKSRWKAKIFIMSRNNSLPTVSLLYFLCRLEFYAVRIKFAWQPNIWLFSILGLIFQSL